MARREVPHSELARYCQIDYDREMTFVALAPKDEAGHQVMAGEVRAVSDPDNRKVEFAIQIAGPWQGKGVGRQLMEKLLRYVRERGVEEVEGQCLHENTGMAALARQLGFTVGRGPSGDTLAMHMVLKP
jgi:acetyltransferase